MFRDRPLTWLFVIATVCVDLVFVVTQGDSGQISFFLSGSLFGQIAVLAIWAVRGPIHRLLRFSCLVLGAWLWVHYIIPEKGVLEFVFFYAATIFAFTLFVEVMRNLPRGVASDMQRRKQWQVPLIEFFGWTIIVAIVSFGCRDMDVKEAIKYQDLGLVWALLFLLSVPFLLVLFARNDLRDLKAIQALILIGITIAAEWYIRDFEIVLQAGYLYTWMTVFTLDNIFAEAVKSRGSTDDNVQAVSEPKLFNPQD